MIAMCCCTLRTGCYWMAGYSLIAAILGTICSSYQLFHIGFDGIQITTLIISIVLLVAAICLIKRLNKSNSGLLMIWLVLFLTLILVQLGVLTYAIYMYILSQLSDWQRMMAMRHLESNKPSLPI